MVSHFGLPVGHPGRNMWEEVGNAKPTGPPIYLDLFVFQKGYLLKPPRKYPRKRKVIVT